MPIPTTNDGSTYYNRNICRSFNQPLSTNLVALSAQTCAEVILYNKTGQDIQVFDSGYSNASNAFVLSNNDSFVIRGLTNSSQVSAKTASGSGMIYYRTQFFSSNISL